jgi:hypothetical protein
MVVVGQFLAQNQARERTIKGVRATRRGTEMENEAYVNEL